MTSESSDDESEVDVSDELAFASFKYFIADDSLFGDVAEITFCFFLSGSSMGLGLGLPFRGGSFCAPLGMLSGSGPTFCA